MKSNMFRLFLTMVVLFAGSAMVSDASAQGNKKGGGGGGDGDNPPPNPIAYEAYFPFTGDHQVTHTRGFKVWTEFPTEFPNGKQYALAVGFNYVTPLEAFVYDHHGFINPDATEKYYIFNDLFPVADLPDWVPTTYTESIFNGVNTSGRVVGMFLNSDNTSQTLPFYFDLKDKTLNGRPTLRRITIPDFVQGRPIRTQQQINENGDMLISFDTNVAGVYEAYIFNPGVNLDDTIDDEIVRLWDADGEPLKFSGRPQFNSFREVAAVRVDGTKIVRFPVGGSPEEYKEFSNISSYPQSAINEAGEFVCRMRVQTKRNQFEDRAVKIGETVLWTASVSSYPQDLNDSGDILIEYSYDDKYLMHEGDPDVAGDEKLLKITSLLKSGYPPAAFQDWRDYGMHKFSNRDSTDFPWIAGRTKIGTNPDGSNKMGWFVLIPENLP